MINIVTFRDILFCSVAWKVFLRVAIATNDEFIDSKVRRAVNFINGFIGCLLDAEHTDDQEQAHMYHLR